MVKYHILYMGRSRMTDRQRRMLEAFFGVELELSEIVQAEIDGYTLARVYSVDDCPYAGDEYCVDAVVLQYEIPGVMLNLLMKDIDVYVFLTMRDTSGRGDIADGRVITVGLTKYGLKPYPVSKYYVDVDNPGSEPVVELGTTD
ncbi:MAG: hypothetical protein QW320_06770 [Ignisphaera sp.]|uniref:hypothetical protein n=1 Tax=Thermofilum sp. TaxID=1961369 RepID=UPI003161E082